ncbi:hypothetical protein GWK48_00550 [Metallosphaera tengchongensis]|uniref:Uncharacterized protein n=1 Tax=Metallosphaera tengchongensis TaxID=1532350 RepID=A0A6N0NQT5_9CREN|nr:hypothetical protein [Metallosphaera tengchongensis]QKQ99085.1 hypothetical protein GWK48_00550 [Metallosphaera tengchongensis]
MPSVVTTFLVVIVALMLSIGAFGLYATYFSGQASSLQQQSLITAQAKEVQTFVSPISFSGLAPSYTRFNVSFLFWYSAPVKNVYIVPFVIRPLPGLGTFLYAPQGAQNATVFVNSSGKIQVPPSVTLNTVYTVQGNQLSSPSGFKAYQVAPTGTYQVNSTIYPGEIIVVWILTYENGHWYRLGYTYVNPADAGLGLYVVSQTGNFNGNSKKITNPPHTFTSQGGIQEGFWFEPIANTSINSIIFQENLTRVGNGNNYTITIYQNGLKLYFNVSTSSGSASTTNSSFIADLNVGEEYFLNFSYGSLLQSAGNINVTLYNQTDKINTKLIGFGGTHNGYNVTVKFGSSSTTDLISQAFLTSEQNNNPNTVAQFYNVSTQVWKNGYFYNNTNNLYNIISSPSNSLYDIVYWYFVYPSSAPPTTINAIVWYYPSGGSSSNSNLTTTYVPESGQNTWII